MEAKYLERIWYGGDYNPNQWPEDEWEGDLALFRQAGINSVTLNVFSWARLQPSEEVYRFDQLDRMIDLYAKAGFSIILATATAALPAWIFKRYPEVARTDFEGRRHTFGKRHNACPNSRVYQHFSRLLAEQLANRYGGNPAVQLWHVNNEYSGACFCENCEKAFRVWLRQRYGTLDALNAAWNTEFWGHTLYTWDEIVAPNRLSEAINRDETAFEGISVDYRRFNSDGLLANFRAERDAIRRFDQSTPITTNLMGTYKTLNYFDWAPEMDIVSWDSYPTDCDPPSAIAMRHDLMRGLKDGLPFLVMEQNPTQQTYSRYTHNRKEPGKMRAWSYQAMAHGADALLFFQLKRSAGASEKYCGAVIDHVGHGQTRVFREVAGLGRELARLGSELLGTRLDSRVGILFDWESYWAVEYDRHRGTNQELAYVEAVHHHYKGFFDRHIQVDMLSAGADFSRYDLIVAPVLYMVGPALQAALEGYVRQGGDLLVTYSSGLVDSTTNIIRGGYPGAFREMAGIWVEETDYIGLGNENQLRFDDGTLAECTQTCDVVHLRGAETVAAYCGDDLFYNETPAITVNRYGAGRLWYCGTRLGEGGLSILYGRVCAAKGIGPVLAADAGLEVTRRAGGAWDYYFVVNHSRGAKRLPEALCGHRELLSQAAVPTGAALEAWGVAIVKVPKGVL